MRTNRKFYTFGIPLILTAVLFLHSGLTEAGVRLPAVFGDNMVLQRNRDIHVWGWADAGERVKLEIDTFIMESDSGEDGSWSFTIPPMEAGGPYVMTVSASDTVTVSNILIGEVWICSGQSNMAFTMGSLKDADHDIASAKYPGIRMLTVPRISAVDPQEDIPADRKPSWVMASPDTIKVFSAVGYYFGKELHERLRVPIGLINSSWGGSVAEAWTRTETLLAYPELAPIAANLDSLALVQPGEMKLFEEKQAAYRKAIQDSIPEPPPYPLPPRGPGMRDYPGGLFNAMIKPLIPCSIAGVIWYQGESNSVRAVQYRTLFPAMIRDWREAWGQGDFPFLYVQLANWETESIPCDGGWGSWPELREAQLRTLSVPNTGMAVIIDIGDPEDIHPNNKWDVGRRLALNALQISYGISVVHSGPIFSAMYRNGSTLRLRFRHVAEGLVAGGLEDLKGFTIAGRDRVFKPATARIEGKEVVVENPEIAEPAAVRYGWDDNPDCNLYNTAGLPASPFRSDSWPEITAGRLLPLK